MLSKECGKLWYLCDDGAVGEYVVTFGVDDETHQDRLKEYLGDRNLEVKFLRDVAAVGVREIVPKYNLDPVKCIISHPKWFKESTEAKEAIVRYLSDKDSVEDGDLFRGIPADLSAWGIACAIALLKKDRWVVEYYRLRHLKTGELRSEWYDDISDLPDTDEEFALDDYSLVTEIVKTTLFGKVVV
jgi:hypothetical protein